MNARTARIWRFARENWSRIARVLTLIICAVAIVLLVRLGSQIDWPAVWRATRDISGPTLIAAGCVAAAGYGAYSGIDYLARRFFRHAQRVWKTMSIAAISYAFNVNLGVLLGAVGIRLRLYRILGLRPRSTAGVVVFGSITNWLGYCWMGGIFFSDGVVRMLTRWAVPPALTRTVGAVLVLVALGYLLLCASGRRHWSCLGYRFKVPSVRMALAQSGLAIASWNAVALIIYLLLGRQIPYLEVLGITLFSSIAILVAHVPGGLGVMEAVFVDALSGRLPTHEVVAAILMYRALYQWGPLCIALPLYLGVEFRTRHGSCWLGGHFSPKENHEL